MNETNTYEQEIDLKDLLIAVLRKWRPIIIVAILLAILLGGYKFGVGLLRQTDAEAVELAQDEYEDAKSVYETTKSSYEREIENIMANIEVQTEYAEKSILMKISPYDKYESSADLFIKTNYEIMPGMIYQNVDFTDSILTAYSSAIKSGKIVEKIAKSKNMDLRYIEELIKVETDFDNKMLHITVSYSDEANANKILDEILKGVEETAVELTPTIGEHTVSVLNQSSGSVVDLELSQLQKSSTDNTSALQSALTEKKAALKALKEPAASTISKRGALKSGIKYGVLGGVLGGFMMVFFYCVGFLMSDKITSVKDLKNRFGLKILGQFQERRKKNFFVDQWIDRIAGNNVLVPFDTIYDVIAANIKNYAPKAGRILVTGGISDDALSQAADKLSGKLSGYELIVSGSMHANATTLQKLPGCDGVVLIEQRGVSTNNSVMEEVDTVRNLGKDIIGCILY